MAKRRRASASLKPCILIVDDNLDEADAKRLALSSRAVAIVRTPSEVTVGDLKCAEVVLVDFALAEWLELQTVGAIANLPKDGLALVAVLRSHCEESWSPTAFALHSARLDSLAGGLPPRSSAHVIARSNNLEWVFSKRSADNVMPMEDQVLALASAVAALPGTWPSDNLDRMQRSVRKLVGLTKSGWSERAWRTLESCHPPVHGIATASHGLAFVRWLLHQVLPFPTFLWDATYVAARLRVTPNSLREALSEKKAARVFAPYRYRGILEDFHGPRWWRAGVEDLLWRRTGSSSFAAEALQAFVRDLSPRLQRTTADEPVVVLGPDLRPSDDLVDVSSAVELQPDEWPAFAETAWGERRAVEADKALQSLVLQRNLLES